MAVLDASYLIDLERGSDAAVAALHWLTEGAHSMRVPAAAAMEYIAGFEDAVANLHDLERSYTLEMPGRDHLLETARQARATFSGGRFPGWMDLQVATVGILHGEEILTANKAHFDAVPCEVWAYRDEVRHSESETP